MSAEPPDDYLWHGEGEGDVFVRRLESLLARYRFEPGAPPEHDQADDDQNGTGPE